METSGSFFLFPERVSVPNLFPEPELLAAYERRTGSRIGFQYEVKGGYAPNAMDVVAEEGEIKTNDADRSVTYPFAASQGRDRIGDFFDLIGMDTSNHEINPQAFLDHGKWCKWSMGLDQDRAKRYTVKVDVQRGIAIATTFIPDLVPEHTQVFEFYKKGILRSGSVGYRTKEEIPLAPDRSEGFPKGKNLRRTELLETSLVFLPCNQDCVRRMYDEPWAGKSLCDAFRAQLEPIRPRKKPWANGAILLTVEVRAKDMAQGKGMKTAPTPSPAMSTTDATGGGALVPHPKKEGAKDVDNPANADAPDRAAEPVSHNVQRMTDVHSVLMALHEMIEENPQLLDHPDVKKFLMKDIGPKCREMAGSVAAKFAETHPDYEQLGENDADEFEETEAGKETQGTEAAPGEDKPKDANPNPEDKNKTGSIGKKDADPVNPDDPKQKPSATDDPKEHEDDDEEDELCTDKGYNPIGGWHAKTPKRKNATGANKGGVPIASGKGMNMSQKTCMKSVGEHLDACSADPLCPPLHRTGHVHYKAMIDDMMTSGKDHHEDGDPALSSDENMEGKNLQLFKEFYEQETKKFEQVAQQIQTML